MIDWVVANVMSVAVVRFLTLNLGSDLSTASSLVVSYTEKVVRRVWVFFYLNKTYIGNDVLCAFFLLLYHSHRPPECVTDDTANHAALELVGVVRLILTEGDIYESISSF